MENPIIAFDESGNTGQKLLDKDQPFFSLASVNFTGEEINELLGIFETNSAELHFKNLRKHPKNQKQIIEFCNHELIDFSNVKYSLSNKKYVVVIHIVDQLIEPVFYDFGIDIYKQGSNIALVNMIYAMLETSWDKKLGNQMLFSFVEMINVKSEKSVKEFYVDFEKLFCSIKKENEQELLLPIRISQYQINEILSGIFKYSIDITYTALTVLAGWWHKELNQKFNIIFDQSKQIQYWKEMIEFSANSDYMEEREVGYGSRKMMFPLKINELRLVDSKLYKQVQLADLVASATSYSIKESQQNKENEFAQELLKTKLLNMEFHALAPTNRFTPQDLEMENESGENPLDYFAEMAQRSKIEFEKISSRLKK